MTKYVTVRLTECEAMSLGWYGLGIYDKRRNDKDIPPSFGKEAIRRAAQKIMSSFIVKENKLFQMEVIKKGRKIIEKRKQCSCRTSDIELEKCFKDYTLER